MNTEMNDPCTLHISFYSLLMTMAVIQRDSKMDGIDHMFSMFAVAEIEDAMKRHLGKIYITPRALQDAPHGIEFMDIQMPKGFCLWISGKLDKLIPALESSQKYGANTIDICDFIACSAFPFLDAVNRELSECVEGKEAWDQLREHSHNYLKDPIFTSLRNNEEERAIPFPSPQDIPDELPSDEELFGPNE